MTDTIETECLNFPICRNDVADANAPADDPANVYCQRHWRDHRDRAIIDMVRAMDELDKYGISISLNSTATTVIS